MLRVSTDLTKFPICIRLAEAGLQFELYEHPPVFTVQEGVEIMSSMPGHGTKNLFLKPKKEASHFLFTISEHKRVDLKKLADSLNVPRFSFGSEDMLMEYLGIEPGSVTILGLLYPNALSVRAYIDEELLSYPQIQCHPLRNDGSIAICPKSLLSYLASQGRHVTPIAIPVS